MKFHLFLLYSAVLVSVHCCEGEAENIPEREALVRTRRRASQTTNQATWRLTAIANRVFAHKLFSKVARNQDHGNIILSPIVVSTGLSMTLLGARGTTADELMKAMGYNDLGTKRNGEKYSQNDVPRLYQNMMTNMKNPAGNGGYMLKSATRLFGDVSQNFIPSFLANTERYYGSRLEQVDFGNNPQGTRDHINEWVSNQTEGTITEALPGDSVSSATLLTLVSTVFFQGVWKYKFDPEETVRDIFNADDGSQVETDFMYGKFALLYVRSFKAKCHIVILPYKNPASEYTVQMELYLPFHEASLGILEQMNEGDFHQELRETSRTAVHLYLPKFRLEYGIELRQALERMGVSSLFAAADLSGMNGDLNLNFGSLTHKTFIEVNEQGTTASGSAAILQQKSASKILHFNRPFFFIIREKFTNTILFMGRIANPQG